MLNRIKMRRNNERSNRPGAGEVHHAIATGCDELETNLTTKESIEIQINIATIIGQLG
jgi:hypothetical protein